MLAVYWKAWGPLLALLILLSIILMQISRNLSDVWLAHWIANIDSNSTLTLLTNKSELNTPFPTNNVLNQASCFLQKIISFSDLSECMTNNNSNVIVPSIPIESQNSYYLAVYITIAIFNSLIALVRAFTFAYGGIKAAKFIHSRLLYSVIFVSNNEDKNVFV